MAVTQWSHSRVWVIHRYKDMQGYWRKRSLSLSIGIKFSGVNGLEERSSLAAERLVGVHERLCRAFNSGVTCSWKNLDG